jgi:hypothetical protein
VDTTSRVGKSGRHTDNRRRRRALPTATAEASGSFGLIGLVDLHAVPLEDDGAECISNLLRIGRVPMDGDDPDATTALVGRADRLNDVAAC